MFNMQNMGMDKFANMMFRRANDVVWDMSTGLIGVRTKDGIATIAGVGQTAYISVNIFDQYSMEVPAFAQSTPVGDVKLGDMIYFGSAGGSTGWVTSIKEQKPTKAQTDKGDNTVVTIFELMKPTGETTNWRAPQVKMLGFGDNGVMVIRSLGNMLPGGQGDLGSMQGNLMMLMQMSGGDVDIEQIMPMMLMSQMQGGGQGSNNIMQTMMMMQMMKGMFGNNQGNGNKNRINTSYGRAAEPPFN